MTVEQIGDSVDKRERILCQRLLAAVIAERDLIPFLRLHIQIHCINKPVNLHGILFALKGVLLIRQPGHIRKQIRRLSVPDCRITLPEILRAIQRLDGMQLCAVIIDHDLQCFIFNCVKHTFYPRVLFDFFSLVLSILP